MQLQLQAIVTVLSLVNPAICAAIFSKLEAGRPAHAKLMDATKASLAIVVILILAALFGVQLLHQFGISLDAFQVAGGCVLAAMGFVMMRGASADPSPPVSGDQEPSLTPLILFAASPGTITGVITITVDHSRFQFPVTAIVAISVAVLVTWLTMIAVARFGGQGGRGLLRDTLSRMMGLIVISMGAQFALTGLKSFFGGDAA